MSRSVDLNLLPMVAQTLLHRAAVSLPLVEDVAVLCPVAVAAKVLASTRKLHEAASRNAAANRAMSLPVVEKAKARSYKKNVISTPGLTFTKQSSSTSQANVSHSTYLASHPVRSIYRRSPDPPIGDFPNPLLSFGYAN